MIHPCTVIICSNFFNQQGNSIINDTEQCPRYEKQAVEIHEYDLYTHKYICLFFFNDLQWITQETIYRCSS